MKSIKKALLICSLSLLISIKSVYSINCYQCSGTDSENPFECNEFLDSDADINPIDCSNIHDAQYCIKHVGRYEGLAIECFQCNSSSSLECGDGLMKLDGGFLEPTSCNHVYNAQYCIKMTEQLTYFFMGNGTQKNAYDYCTCYSRAYLKMAQGTILTRFYGGISTKRYCSSLDLGNYCNYVAQPGDKLEYRTCIYTCNSDGCNSATNFKGSIILFVFTFLTFLCFI